MHNDQVEKGDTKVGNKTHQSQVWAKLLYLYFLLPSFKYKGYGV